MDKHIHNIIFGKNKLERITSIEVGDSNYEVFTEDLEGNVHSEFYPIEHWLLTNKPIFKESFPLKGKSFYNFVNKFDNLYDVDKYRKYCKNVKVDYYRPFCHKEATLIKEGLTYFKGMKHTEPTILSFDIETTSLNHDSSAKIILITNTYRKNGKIERKLFCYDEYETQGDLLEAWCNWFREKNPSIICGHNIYGFDLPYMAYIASKQGITLDLGRDGSSIRFNSFPSKFRIEQNRFLEYYKCFIYGREIADTMFLSYKYDIGRKYISYGLKSIIKQENLEVKDRVFYDASKIRFNYKNPEEMEKIKQYAIFDADDSLALYDLMCPSYFYLTTYIPKSYQEICVSASGSQINSMMVRSYLQDNYSIPKASLKTKYEGAISRGNPGIYNNCVRWDCVALYPSITLTYEVYDKEKDPKKHLLIILEQMLKDRIKNKQLYKQTKDPYYDGLQASQKIFCNSTYGFMGSEGSNYNFPSGAAYITMIGREILKHAIEWASGCNYEEWSKKNKLEKKNS